MRITCKLLIFTGLACFLVIAGDAGSGWSQSQNNQKAPASGLQQRIDFGNAYIMGQTIQSGAVYLLHRKQSDIKSMLQYRKDYRQEILENFIIEEANIQNTQFTDQDSGVFRKPVASQ